MKLLLDQNLSPNLISDLIDLFPESQHVRELNLHSASDKEIWNFSLEHNFSIVSKDSDFQKFSFLLGPPPKVIWIRRGNCSTAEILHILRAGFTEIQEFNMDSNEAFLILE